MDSTRKMVHVNLGVADSAEATYGITIKK
jgi:hypothetical protein